MRSSHPDITLANALLGGRTIALCVTGSIAAYKAVEVARLCIKAGARVVPVMTRSASQFVGPVTLAGICGEAAQVDMWDPSFPGELHVSLAERADVVAIVPATADVLARLAHGRADDLVTALALCAKGPVLAAPAMHPRMWDHPATQRNVAALAEQRRITLIGPVSGEVASGDVGYGRMVEPATIYAAIVNAFAPRDLIGLRVVVTAGPTIEDLDPVRFLSNRSTGKMGFAIAACAAARGARVTLVSGPVALATPWGARRVDVRSAREMQAALGVALDDACDALVMTAAVSDYRPAETAKTKQKKAAGETTRALALVQNPDLLATIGRARKGSRPVLVGFAVETASDARIVAYARKKLAEKRVDLVVANHASDAFGRDDNRATLVTARAAEALPAMTKKALADRVLDRVRRLLDR